MKLNFFKEFRDSIEFKRNCLKNEREEVLDKHKEMVENFPFYLKLSVLEYIDYMYDIFDDIIKIDIEKTLDVDKRLYEWKSDFIKDLSNAKEIFEKETGLNVYIDINNENNLNLTIIGEVDMKKEYKYTPPENDYDDRDVYGEVRIENNK